MLVEVQRLDCNKSKAADPVPVLSYSVIKGVGGRLLAHRVVP